MLECELFTSQVPDSLQHLSDGVPGGMEIQKFVKPVCGGCGYWSQRGWLGDVRSLCPSPIVE